MTRSDFNEFIHYRALAYKYEVVQGRNLSDKIDQLIDGFPEGGGNIGDFKVPEVKNVCAKLSVQLSDHLDEVCAKLSLSKRQFIEMALIQALEYAEHALECVQAEGEEDGDE